MASPEATKVALDRVSLRRAQLQITLVDKARNIVGTVTSEDPTGERVRAWLADAVDEATAGLQSRLEDAERRVNDLQTELRRHEARGAVA